MTEGPLVYFTTVSAFLGPVLLLLELYTETFPESG